MKCEEVAKHVGKLYMAPASQPKRMQTFPSFNIPGVDIEEMRCDPSYRNHFENAHPLHDSNAFSGANVKNEIFDTDHLQQPQLYSQNTSLKEYTTTRKSELELSSNKVEGGGSLMGIEPSIDEINNDESHHHHHEQLSSSHSFEVKEEMDSPTNSQEDTASIFGTSNLGDQVQAPKIFQPYEPYFQFMRYEDNNIVSICGNYIRIISHNTVKNV